MKVIIDIPKSHYEALRKSEVIMPSPRSGKTFMSTIYSAVAHGIPLEDVKAEIEQIRLNRARFRTSDGTVVYVDSQNILEVLNNILDRIGKESETN